MDSTRNRLVTTVADRVDKDQLLQVQVDSISAFVRVVEEFLRGQGFQQTEGRLFCKTHPTYNQPTLAEAIQEMAVQCECIRMRRFNEQLRSSVSNQWGDKIE